MTELDQLIDEITSEAPGIDRGLVMRAAKAGYFLALPRRKQSPDGLQFLQDDMAKKAGRLTRRLGAGEIDQAAWEKEMQALIARYHTAALMLGQGSDEIDAQAAEILLNMTDDQFAYLANFGAEMVSAAEWQEGYAARAESYAGAIKEPYWTGEVDFLPLPAMPAQGTQCRTNCGCSWRIEVIDEAEGDYDAYWERSKEDSCDTCIEREAQWSPVRIRGGLLE